MCIAGYRALDTGRGACWNHAINSFRAMLYTRFVIGEETLSSTSVFNFSHWAIFSIATKSFIFSPFNGHYRPPEHYLWRADTSSEDGRPGYSLIEWKPRE
jgi:hypothetical protein